MCREARQRAKGRIDIYCAWVPEFLDINTALCLKKLTPKLTPFGRAVLGGITSGLLYIFSGRAPLITVLDRAFAMFGRWRLATLEEKH